MVSGGMAKERYKVKRNLKNKNLFCAFFRSLRVEQISSFESGAYSLQMHLLYSLFL